jgi:hypothetical protein
MLIRIFRIRRNLLRVILAVTTILISYCVAAVLAGIFVCKPISAFWDGGGNCINENILFIVSSFISFITDATILVLPIILAWTLNVPLGKKFRVGIILGAGGLATVSSIYRLWLVFIYRETADTSFYEIHLMYTAYVSICPQTIPSGPL